MPEHDFFDDCYPSSSRRPPRRKSWVRRFSNWLDAVAHRVAARPAQSAVAALAIGVIVGSFLRATVFHHSGPNSAAGSVVNGTDAAPAIKQQPIPMMPRSSQPRPGAAPDKDAPIEAPDGVDSYQPAIPGTRGNGD